MPEKDPRIRKLVLACAAGALGGLAVGAVAGVLFGVHGTPAPAFLWIGAVVGAGLGALLVLARRPDPRATNRQDPPIDLDE